MEWEVGIDKSRFVRSEDRDIEKCKKCKLHKLDTLSDGTKEDYCYPPYNASLFRGFAFGFSLPCSERTKEHCIELQKLQKSNEENGFDRIKVTKKQFSDHMKEFFNYSDEVIEKMMNSKETKERFEFVE